MNVEDALLALFSWKLTLFLGDPTNFDRWRWLKRYLKGGPLRTLDAGCGSGFLTFYAAKIGNEAWGVDLSQQNIEVARRRAKIWGIFNAYFLQLDLKNLEQFRGDLGFFDQIICFETIEHVGHEYDIINNLAMFLKPGGQLILTAPYRYHRKLLGDHVPIVEDGGHLRYGYTHKEIRHLFERCGLEVEAEAFISGFVSQKLTDLQRLLHRLCQPTWTLMLPFRILQLLDKVLTRVLAYPYLSIGVVAIKRLVNS